MMEKVIFAVLLLSDILFAPEASKPRCAVVVLINEPSSSSVKDFTKYLDNIQGISLNKTSVFFSDDPDSFKVKHGKFIGAPGLFALESERFPGMYLRRAENTMALQPEQHSQSFKNDATFLMDNANKNESFSSLTLFSHRSWRPFLLPDSRGHLLDSFKRSGDIDLLVIAQPCRDKDEFEDHLPKNHSRGIEAKMTTPKPDESIQDLISSVTHSPGFLDPVLNQQTDTKFIKAITNKGDAKNISNEYSFENFKIPDFVLHSLLEDGNNAGDGIDIPEQNPKPASANLVKEKPQQSKIEHETKPPTAKKTISGLLFNNDEVDDIEETLKDFQYGAKGCKLLVAEDSEDENAAVKDNVAHPTTKKECKDEFADSCHEMARKGHCLAFKSLMSSVCRKSCNLCASLVDTGFTTCSKTCGGGRQMRMIKIHRREYLQTRRCNTKPCPIDGGYSEFHPYTECSTTCGKGVQYRRRFCNKPRSQFGGKSCQRLGPSIESRACEAKPCVMKHHHHYDDQDIDDDQGVDGDQDINDDNNHIQRPAKARSQHRHKSNLHIGGKHSNKVHEHVVLLKGKKVAKIKCKPRKGQLRNIIQDSENYKRFIIHGSSIHKESKKSDIEERKIVYNKEGLPVDTSHTVVDAFKSPYKIILARKGTNKMKLVEECFEEDNDNLHSREDWTGDDPEDDADYFEQRYSSKGKHEDYSKPRQESYKDFDEYKFEKGNVVTPDVTTRSEAENNDDYATPQPKLFPNQKGLDFFLDKMNAVKPRLEQELSEENNIESSYKMDESFPERQSLNSAEQLSQQDLGNGADNTARAGFTVTTAPDSHMPVDKSGDNNGYEVESVPDG